MAFTVLEGSIACLSTTKTCPKGTLKTREQLLEKCIIAEKNGSYLFIEDYEFSSPSAAAAFICGRSTNGLTGWVNKEKMTLKELESAD